jgi:hypothetical protein
LLRPNDTSAPCFGAPAIGNFVKVNKVSMYRAIRLAQAQTHEGGNQEGGEDEEGMERGWERGKDEKGMERGGRAIHTARGAVSMCQENEHECMYSYVCPRARARERATEAHIVRKRERLCLCARTRMCAFRAIIGGNRVHMHARTHARAPHTLHTRHVRTHTRHVHTHTHALAPLCAAELCSIPDPLHHLGL